jgi:hypothetical protein
VSFSVAPLDEVSAWVEKCRTFSTFEAERQALALMDHPNIAKVHREPGGSMVFAVKRIEPIHRLCPHSNHHSLASAPREEWPRQILRQDRPGQRVGR